MINYADIVKRIFVDVPEEDILEIPITKGNHYNRAYDTLVLSPEYRRDKPYRIVVVDNWVYFVLFWKLNNGSSLYHIKMTMDLSKIQIEV